MKNDSTYHYRIDNPTERQILIGYRVLLSISVLIGDSLILVGSLRYNAIKLHKIIVIFVQHMAVADFMVTLFGIIPGAVSLEANGWILGDTACYISYIFNDSSAIFQSLITTAIAISKMLIVLYPLRAAHLSPKAGQVSAICIWLLSITFPAVAVLKGRDGVFFDYIVYSCDFSTNSTGWTKTELDIFDTAIGTITLTSLLGTVIGSIALLVIAKRFTSGRPGGLQWQGVLAILLTAAAHVLLVLPLSLYLISRAFTKEHITSLSRWGYWITQLGSLINFYILGLSLPSFRDFLKSRIFRRVVLMLGRNNEEETSETEGATKTSFIR